MNKFNMLGDALRYGLLYELHDLISGSKEAIHLYACLTYMKYKGYVEQKTIDCFNAWIFIGRTMIEKHIQKICKDILSDIMKKKEINSFDELISLLNAEQIPDWCFNIGKWVVEADSSKYYIHNDKLYYINNDYFLGRNLESICSEKSMDHNYGFLGSGYTSIYKFDGKNMKVYLKAKRQPNKVHCYDILTNTFKIYKGRIHSLTETYISIVTDDGYLAVIKEDRLRKIVKYDVEKKYMLHEDEKFYLVCPGKKFFVPYKVSIDGKIFPAEQSEVQMLLWRKLVDTAKIYDPDKIEKFLKDSRIRDVSLDGIKNMFSDYAYKNKNEKYELLLDTFEIIGKYVDSKADITNLLYSIIESNRIVSNGGDFPSRRFYYKFKEFVEEQSEEFSKIIDLQEYDKLVSYFSHNSEHENYSCNFHIGEIICENANIKISLAKGEREIVVGDYIIPKIDYNNNYFGMIAYNCDQDNYIVVTKRTLTESEKKNVIEECKLLGANVIYTVNVECVVEEGEMENG